MVHDMLNDLTPLATAYARARGGAQNSLTFYLFMMYIVLFMWDCTDSFCPQVQTECHLLEISLLCQMCVTSPLPRLYHER